MKKIEPTPQMRELLKKYTLEYCVSLLEQDDLAVARLVGIATGQVKHYDRSWDGGMKDENKSKEKSRTDNESQFKQKSRSAKA